MAIPSLRAIVPCRRRALAEGPGEADGFGMADSGFFRMHSHYTRDGGSPRMGLRRRINTPAATPSSSVAGRDRTAPCRCDRSRLLSELIVDPSSGADMRPASRARATALLVFIAISA